MMHRVRTVSRLASSLQRASLASSQAASLPLPLPVPAAAPARSLFTRSPVLLAPKGARKGKKDDVDAEDVDVDAPAPTLDSAAAAAAAPADAREAAAARRAKKAAAAAAAEAEAESDKKSKKAKKAPTNADRAVAAASSRRSQMSVESVIEKEVPLMDLSGLTPGQNKFAEVLTLLREQNYPAEVIADLEQVGDLATGSTAEILSGRLANLRARYGRMPHDTGSAEVQVAMLTERLKGYERHQVVHGADIAARKNFLAVWQRRRKLLKYLRRTRYETYAYMMRELQLKETDIDNYGLDRKSATQAPRIKRD